MDMDMDADQILEVATQIRKDAESKKYSKEEIETKYETFANKYPALFDRLRRPEESLDMFYMMISKLKAHSTTQDAGKEVGDILFKKYLPARFYTSKK